MENQLRLMNYLRGIYKNALHEEHKKNKSQENNHSNDKELLEKTTIFRVCRFIPRKSVSLYSENNNDYHCKIMKKVLFILATAFIFGLFLASCKTHVKCAAYGEAHKYQRETRY
jgi:hypothetical protein